MKNYFRVVPRDLFNEAKLLKCLGLIALLIVDGKLILDLDFDGEFFDIQQDENDGSISCVNFQISLGDEPVFLFSPLNSRENFPLRAMYRDEEYVVFGETGEYLPAFGRRT